MTFQEKLAELMARKGLNNSDLARGIGKTPSAVKNWLVGKSCYPSTRRQLAKFLDVPIEVLEDDSRDLPEQPLAVGEAQAAYGQSAINYLRSKLHAHPDIAMQVSLLAQIVREREEGTKKPSGD